MQQPLRIHYTSDFRKAYRRLPKRIQDAVDRKDALFRKNPFNPVVKTHKLHGRLEELWSFWVVFEYRILFEFIDGGAVFYDLGTHDIYK